MCFQLSNFLWHKKGLYMLLLKTNEQRKNCPSCLPDRHHHPSPPSLSFPSPPQKRGVRVWGGKGGLVCTCVSQTNVNANCLWMPWLLNPSSQLVCWWWPAVEIIYGKAIAGLYAVPVMNSFECKHQCLASYGLRIYSDWWYVHGIKHVMSRVAADSWIPVYTQTFVF